MSNYIRFSWDSVQEDVTYNLYENNVLIVSNLSSLTFDLLMGDRKEGTYTYYVTAVDNSQPEGFKESDPSTSVEVQYTLPKKPQTPLNLSYKLYFA